MQLHLLYNVILYVRVYFLSFIKLYCSHLNEFALRKLVSNVFNYIVGLYQASANTSV